jgi:hypothetical protein
MVLKFESRDTTAVLLAEITVSVPAKFTVRGTVRSGRRLLPATIFLYIRAVASAATLVP